MNGDFFLDISNEAIKIALMLAAPMLGGALMIGIMVSLFQAVTQINEQTLSFIPKILVIAGAIVICSPWMMDTLTSFTEDLIIRIPSIVAAR